MDHQSPKVQQTGTDRAQGKKDHRPNWLPMRPFLLPALVPDLVVGQAVVPVALQERQAQLRHEIMRRL